MTERDKQEAFVRSLSEVDQAGDMLAVERARAKRWKAAAKRARESLGIVQRSYFAMAQGFEEMERERDEARAALMRRISRDGGAVRYGLD